MAVKGISHIAYRISPKNDKRLAIGDKQFGRIGVLMGGPSAERDVSLKSGNSVWMSLKQLNLDVVGIDITTDRIEENKKIIRSANIDCAFLALHGRFGEDGQIQEILDCLNIPYTGSGVLASRLAMDKVATRKILEVYGLPVPKYNVCDKFCYNAHTPKFFWKGCAFPLVVKPATQGSSIGLTIVDEKQQLQNALERAFGFDEQVIIEEYIRGRELTVGIFDNRALPVIEIVPKKRFFDYEAKYQSGLTDYLVPADLEKNISKKVQSVAVLAHRLLGCFGCSRVDIILNKDNIPVILELNSIPGFTATSLLPKAAKVVGLEFSQLCLRLIQLAYEKTGADRRN